MRPYDYVSGRRFDQTHPLWPVVKSGPNKGKPSERLMASHIAALGNQIELVPNLTHLTDLIGSFGGFSQGAEWGSREAMTAVLEYGMENYRANPNWFKFTGPVYGAVRKRLDRAASEGSDIHDGIEKMIKGGEVTDEVLWLGVCQVLEKMGCNSAFNFETEGQYVTKEFGFTLDFADHDACVILDWKTVDDESWWEHVKVVDGKKIRGSRKPKPSEALQLAVIQDTLERRFNARYRAANVYIGRQSMRILALVEWPHEMLDYMARVFFPDVIQTYKHREMAVDMVSNHLKGLKALHS